MDLIFGRSEPINCTKEERDNFIFSIRHELRTKDHIIKVNDFPYTLCNGVPIKLEHLTLWYNDKTHEGKLNLEFQRRKYKSLGYTVVDNADKDKSIPEIPHCHLLKRI